MQHSFIFLILTTPGVQLILIIIILVLIIYFRRKRLNRIRLKYQKNQPLDIQYNAPENLSPLEIGILSDLKSGRPEVLAIIYQLVSKKIIAIEEGANQNTILRLLNYPGEELASYEDLILKYFFRESRVIKFSDAIKTEDFIIMPGYIQFLGLQELQKKGYMYFNEQFVDQTYLEYQKGLGVIGSITYVINYLFNGYEKNLTKKGKELMPDINGFIFFIKYVELERIKFHLQAKFQQYIEDMAPYAIAMGEVERWQTINYPLLLISEARSADEPGYSYQDIYDAINRLDSYKVVNN